MEPEISMQHHEPLGPGLGGHITLTRCWSCISQSHYEEVTWHSWADSDDMRPDDPEYNERIKKQKCACDCAGPITKETDVQVQALYSGSSDVSGEQGGQRSEQPDS